MADFTLNDDGTIVVHAPTGDVTLRRPTFGQYRRLRSGMGALAASDAKQREELVAILAEAREAVQQAGDDQEQIKAGMDRAVDAEDAFRERQATDVLAWAAAAIAELAPDQPNPAADLDTAPLDLVHPELPSLWVEHWRNVPAGPFAQRQAARLAAIQEARAE